MSIAWWRKSGIRRLSGQDVPEFPTGQGTMNQPRLAVIAHAMRAAGSLSVARNLVQQFSAQRPASPILFTVPEGGRVEPADAPSHHQFIPFRRGSLLARWVWDELHLPKLISTFRPDVLVALGNRGVSRVAAPQVLLCHDAHYFYPSSFYSNETLPWKAKFAYQRMRMRRDLKSTRLLFCQTQTARQRMRQWYRFDHDIQICANAVSSHVAPLVDEDSPPPARRGALTLLCLSRYYSHKNLELLVETFQQYRPQLDDVVVWITITADQHPRAKRLLNRITSLGLEQHIINVGPLEQDQLASYYMHADGLILPTTLESFSGSYVEAMQYGRPILTSDLDFARDVCGQAACYFNPWSADCLLASIEKFRSPELRHRLVREGRVRLHQLGNNWGAIANTMLESIDAMLATSREPIRRAA
jgi:glycosyltransferase involved in cell wall biosynthesis